MRQLSVPDKTVSHRLETGCETRVTRRVPLVGQ